MIPIRDTIPSRGVSVVTWSLIAANVAVFLFELTLDPEELEGLFYLFGVVPARFTHPAWASRLGFPVDEYWPFLTSMFLHDGWLHVISNMWALWIFGDNVEERMGPRTWAGSPGGPIWAGSARAWWYIGCFYCPRVAHCGGGSGTSMESKGRGVVEPEAA